MHRQLELLHRVEFDIAVAVAPTVWRIGYTEQLTRPFLAMGSRDRANGGDLVIARPSAYRRSRPISRRPARLCPRSVEHGDLGSERASSRAVRASLTQRP